MSIINANNIIQEFREQDFQAYVNSNPVNDLNFRNYFPSLFNTDLNFANLEGNTGAKVMAPLVSLNANVELKGRDFVEKIKGEIPKIEVGRKMTERDFFRLQGLRLAVQTNPTNSAIKQQMINLMYGDGRFVVDSVNARLEFMAKQLMSTGKYTAQNGVNVDFGLTVENSAKDWFASTTTNADYHPIKEIEKLQKVALSKGFRYTNMVMDLETFNKFIEAKSVVSFTASYSQVALGLQNQPTLEQLNTALQAKALPTITIWESYVSDEDKAGNVTSTSAWEKGNILLSASADYGNTQFTVSPEASIKLNESSKFTVDDFILVSVIGTAKPMSVATVGMAFATPVLNETSKKVILKTKLA